MKGKLANGVGSQYSHATSERGISSITQADAHTSVTSGRLNWRPHRFKWTRPFRGKTKSGFCACAITFRTSYTGEEFWCWCLATLLTAVLVCGHRLSFFVPRRFENWNCFRIQVENEAGTQSTGSVCENRSVSLSFNICSNGPPQYGAFFSIWRKKLSKHCGLKTPTQWRVLQLEKDKQDAHFFLTHSLPAI